MLLVRVIGMQKLCLDLESSLSPQRVVLFNDMFVCRVWGSRPIYDRWASLMMWKIVQILGRWRPSPCMVWRLLRQQNIRTHP